MKKTLLDSSSAIILLKAGLLKDLSDIYHVFVTGAVLHELTRGRRYGVDIFRQYVRLNRIAVIELEDVINLKSGNLDLPDSLGRGERNTIRCFMSGSFDFMILDDGRAARFCKENNMDFINALLFPKLLNFMGYLSLQECNKKLNRVINFGRYSAEIVEWARNCRKDSLAFAVLH